MFQQQKQRAASSTWNERLCRWRRKDVVSAAAAEIFLGTVLILPIQDRYEKVVDGFRRWTDPRTEEPGGSKHRSRVGIRFVL